MQIYRNDIVFDVGDGAAAALKSCGTSAGTFIIVIMIDLFFIEINL
jgi:hypothetical protein